MLSIIIPAFREAENLPVLLDRIVKTLERSSIRAEIIIVDDDSKDGTVQAVERFISSVPVFLIVRKEKPDLSAAVLAGIDKSSGEAVLVMDADLSHPPETIPQISGPVLSGEADFVIGSRFIEGGDFSSLSAARRLAALLARVPALPFTSVKDPHSGFFAFRKDLLERTGNEDDNVTLDPVGLRIGLEILVKTRPKRILEIPIVFGRRLHGRSKLNLRVLISCFRHLMRLLAYRYPVLAEFIKFCAVGTVATLLDLGSVSLFYGVLSIHFRISRGLGFILGFTSNFTLNRRFTFRGARKGKAAMQYFVYLGVCATGFFLNWLVSVLLFENVPFFNRHYLVASFIGVLCGLGINFTGGKYAAFRPRKRKKRFE